MKKKIALGLVILVVVTLLVLGALVAAPVFMDPLKYRPEVENSISKVLGRPVSLGDNLHLSLFPTAGIHFDRLKVANAPGFEQENLLTIKSLEVRAGLWPLLTGELRIKRFVMVEPRLFLERKDGRGNWEYLGGSSAPPSPGDSGGQPSGDQPESGPEQDNQADTPWSRLSVHELEIKDGLVSWKDQDQNQGPAMEIGEISVFMESGASGGPMDLDLSARINQQPVSLRGTISPATDQGSMTAIQMDLDLKAQDRSEMKVAGRLGLTGDGSGTDLTLEVPPFSLRGLLIALAPDFPIRTRDPRALEKVGLKAHVTSDGPFWELKEGRIDLDDSQMELSARLTPGSQPRLDFDLNLNVIDLDRYREPETPDTRSGETDTTPNQEKATPGDATAEEPKARGDQYEVYRNLEVKGRLKADQVKFVGVVLDALKIDISGSQGRFNFDPFDFNLYGGPVAMKAQLDVREPKPAGRIDFKGQNIQVGPIFRVLEETTFMEGTMAAEFELTGRGETGQEIVPTLNGRGNVKVMDGSFETGYMPEVVLKLLTTAGVAVKSGQRTRLPFSRHEIPFTMVNGVIITPRVYLKSSQLTVTARGRTDLVKQTLSFDVDNQIANGPRVPMEVGGTFDNPTFKVDWKNILKLPVPEEGKDLLKKIPLFN